jgi:hypothetical protein
VLEGGEVIGRERIREGGMAFCFICTRFSEAYMEGKWRLHFEL